MLKHTPITPIICDSFTQTIKTTDVLSMWKFCSILLFGDWEIIGLENEKRSEVLGVNKNSPIDDGE